MKSLKIKYLIPLVLLLPLFALYERNVNAEPEANTVNAQSAFTIKFTCENCGSESTPQGTFVGNHNVEIQASRNPNSSDYTTTVILEITSNQTEEFYKGLSWHHSTPLPGNIHWDTNNPTGLLTPGRYSFTWEDPGYNCPKDCETSPITFYLTSPTQGPIIEKYTCGISVLCNPDGHPNFTGPYFMGIDKNTGGLVAVKGGYGLPGVSFVNPNSSWNGLLREEIACVYYQCP